MMSGDFRKAITTENPLGALLLGLCPAAAVSVRVIDALWMSAGVFVVLILASLSMTLLARAGHGGRGALRENAPIGRWLGALLVSSCLTASFEAALLLLSPAASANLGIYVPLIAVNCLVLARMDAASRGASVRKTVEEAAGSGIGFAACLVLIAVVREALGAGTITLFAVGRFSGVIALPGLSEDPARALGFAGGGLLCLGYLAGASRALRLRNAGRTADKDGRP